MQLVSLYLFHLIYYISVGCATFVPKLYGELGMTDSRIGLLTSVPTVICLFITPMIGQLSDRVSKKRILLAALMLGTAGAGLLTGRFGTFLPLLIGVTLYQIFSGSVQPIATNIAIEYTSSTGKSNYGSVRLLGTVGYQAGTLLVGFLLSRSLRNLYPLMGAVVFLAMFTAFAMPDVRGHQHDAEKVPIFTLFRYRNVRWLYGIIFLATLSTQFYASFFTKYLGDLNMSNTVTGWITLLSVMAELPFLYFADRLAKKTNVWNWLLIAIVCNGIRWLGLALFRNAVIMILFQLPGVTVLACYEFFPALYLNRTVPKELTGSAQTLLTLTTFGAAKIIASLAGGFIAERIGIAAVFIANGVLTLALAALFFLPSRKLIREDIAEGRLDPAGR